MSRRQVHHVNVVTYASTVMRGVVIAVYMHKCSFADCNLGHIGNEVVWNSLGIFSHQPGRMSSDRIEVAQQHNIPLRIGSPEVTEYLLDHPLGPTIGVGRRLLGAFLSERQLVRVAVDGGAARENN